MGDELPITAEDFMEAEVKAVVEQLRKGRASGSGDTPAEFWQTIVGTTEGLGRKAVPTGLAYCKRDNDSQEGGKH